MCTKSYFRIKSVSPAGIKYSFLPCGKCFDCRQSLKSQWIFRVRAELTALTAKGWKIGFFTLTYNDEHLPLIPEDLIKGPYRPIPCFNKEHIRHFVNKVRKWLQKKYKCLKDDKPRMMICSEFGELRHRPHYHGIICFPSRVDAVELHRYMKKIWYSPTAPDCKGMDDGFGYFGPFNFDGDVDENGKIGKGFICDSVKAGALYACKYVCKDINFLESVADVDFYKKRKYYWCETKFEKVYLDDSQDCLSSSLFDGVKAYGQALDGLEECYLERSRLMVELPPYHELKLSNYFPFHFQSRGMGRCLLENKTDLQLLDLYKNGFLFDGDPEVSQLPVYLKNKIIFTPKYSFDEKTGKRLVRRDASRFFLDNLSEIFDCKKRAMLERFRKFADRSYWKSLDLSSEDLKTIRFYEDPILPIDQLAELSLCYYGVPYRESYDINHSLQYMRRFNYDVVSVAGCHLISRSLWSYIQEYNDGCFRMQAKYEWLQTSKREKEFREKERISQFFKFKH